MQALHLQPLFRIAVAAALAAPCVWCCGVTDDVIGFNVPPAASGGFSGDADADADADVDAAGGQMPAPERTYPNAFGELLGKTEAEISDKLELGFHSLFHGDPATEAVFVEVGTDGAYLLDIRDNEVRDDGMGYAMMISVELDKQTEFEQMWRWADTYMVSKDGALAGYLRHRCDPNGVCTEEVDPLGHFFVASALLLADGRWGSAGTIDYRAAAVLLLDATFRAEASASTGLGELVGMIDPAAELPRSTPYASSAGTTRSALMLPAYFALWAEKSVADRGRILAENARSYWQASAHPSTGLFPDATSLSGDPIDAVFTEHSYGALLALALDGIWFEKTPAHVVEADRLLEFFAAQGITEYGTDYSLDGQLLAANTPQALWAANGAVAAIASTELKRDFVQVVWDMPVPTGDSRKFAGLFYLMSSLLLSGRYRVY